MPNRSISQPAARTFSVVDLVAAALEGRIRIPEFQRPLRWQWEDVRRLFDSIVKGYPIGNLLLWKRPAPAARVKLGGLNIDARQFDEGWWVVDGQQRLTSLANALSVEGAKDDRFSMAYDLRKRDFVRPNKEEDGHIIPLPVLFDLQELIRWFTKDHPEAGEKLDEASRVTRAIREYQVPAYLVDQNDANILRDIFDRMNNYGKRLSRAEVFSALHPGTGNSLEPSSHFQRIAESIHSERGFGLVDDDTVMRAVLARRGGNVSRDIRIEFSEGTRKARDFADETPEAAYRSGEEALTRAVIFLQEEAGVPHFAFLAYRYLLVVLTRFFAHFPTPQPRNIQLLRRWFWRAAMVGPGPFSSSWTIAMSTLADRINPGNETETVQSLLEEPIDRVLHLPTLVGFRTNSAQSRIVLAALWALGPRSLISGEKYSRQQLTEAIQPDATLREVVPRIFSREPENCKAWAANRIIVLEDELSDTMTNLLLARSLVGDENARDILASHAIDGAAVSILASGDKVAFLHARQDLMKTVIRSFLERMAETHLEDTPPLDAFDLDDDQEDRDDPVS